MDIRKTVNNGQEPSSIGFLRAGFGEKAEIE